MIASTKEWWRYADRGYKTDVWRIHPDGTGLEQLTDLGNAIAWQPRLLARRSVGPVLAGRRRPLAAVGRPCRWRPGRGGAAGRRRHLPVRRAAGGDPRPGPSGDRHALTVLDVAHPPARDAGVGQRPLIASASAAGTAASRPPEVCGSCASVTSSGGTPSATVSEGAVSDGCGRRRPSRCRRARAPARHRARAAPQRRRPGAPGTPSPSRGRGRADRSP